MIYQYSNLIAHEQRPFSFFDALILVLILGIFSLFAWAAQSMATPYSLGDPIAISLEISALPVYSLRTVLRMLLGMVISLLFTFMIGTLAAYSRRAERVIIPFIDIMQSIPVLGFLSISVIPFIHLFPNRLLGPECAAIFAIFTSQAWNMTLGFYQSLKTLPEEWLDVTYMLRLSAWQRFWSLKVPYAMPTLLWNSMMSMSAGWFFVVASEAITVSQQTIYLPGIGSYIQVALNQHNTAAILYAMIAMFLVIIAYDQLLFRPLLAWSQRFKDQISDDDEEPSAWFLDWLQSATWIQAVWSTFWQFYARLTYRFPKPTVHLSRKSLFWMEHCSFFIWNILSVLAVGLALFFSFHIVFQQLTFEDVKHVTILGSYTALRVFACVVLSSFIWVPIGIWAGFRPRYANLLQTIAQFLASFPANLAYPFFFWLLLKYELNLSYWSIPLMMLGTQWYILFNIIAGASTLSREQHWVVASLQVKGWLWWKRFALPAVFPHYVTGAMAAAGGCWNASILAELVESGGERMTAPGLGAYIAEVTQQGDFARITLSITVMCLFVMGINHLVWQKLYQKAQELS